jgi:excisionase family DNA binding protein
VFDPDDLAPTLDRLPACLTPEETARLLRIGRTACYDAIRCGVIPSIRLGPRSIRVPRDALLDLLAQATAQERPSQ